MTTPENEAPENGAFQKTALEGKTVLVTGGRKGIGAAFVDEALKRGAAKVYSTAREPYDEIRGRVVPLQFEATSESSAAALAQAAPDAEILINNAGVLLSGALLSAPMDDVLTTFDTNVFGPLRVVRAFAPVLRANGGGAIVDVHSVLSWLGGAGAYGASKAAFWSITNSLRMELRGQRTHVLGVHVGFVDTDMVAALPVPKTPPHIVAGRVLDALAEGQHEVLVDEFTVGVKAALAGPVEQLVFPPNRA